MTDTNLIFCLEGAKRTGEKYHYLECGLSNVYLANGFHKHETNYGDGHSVDNAEGLHKVIGKTLVGLPRPLEADELRFMRIQMNLSQKRIGGFFDVEDQTIANYEKGKTVVPRSTEIVLRAIFKEYLDEGGSTNITALVNTIADLDTGGKEKEERETVNDGEWASCAAA